jgi:hypothetical protein
MTAILGVEFRTPPKIAAKILKNAMGRIKLSANEARSRRNAVIAARMICKINRATPFR